jgi:hypothetical protein
LNPLQIIGPLGTKASGGGRQVFPGTRSTTAKPHTPANSSGTWVRRIPPGSGGQASC